MTSRAGRAVSAVASEPTSDTITLPVAGMTCAACQANVQRALARTPGVQQATVNLMLHEAAIVFDPRLTSRHQRHRIFVDAARG
jgi:P-type Cu+ transporter